MKFTGRGKPEPADNARCLRTVEAVGLVRVATTTGQAVFTSIQHGMASFRQGALIPAGSSAVASGWSEAEQALPAE